MSDCPNGVHDLPSWVDDFADVLSCDPNDDLEAWRPPYRHDDHPIGMIYQELDNPLYDALNVLGKRPGNSLLLETAPTRHMATYFHKINEGLMI